MKILEFVKRTGALVLCLLLMLPAIPVLGTGADASPSLENPTITVSWDDENGNRVPGVAAMNLGVDPVTGLHNYFFQLTDPYAIQNRMGSLFVSVDNTQAEAVYTPDLPAGFNFNNNELYQLDVPIPITKNQPEPKQTWYLTVSLEPLPTEDPGGDQSGGDQSGGDQSGGDQSGGDQSGGDQSGGDQSGGDQSGGDQSGGDQSGGDQSGGDQSGGDQTGGDQSGTGQQTNPPASPTATPAIDVSVASEGVSKGEVNVRSEPSLDGGTGNVVVVIPDKTLLYIEGQLQGSTNTSEKWYRVTLEGDAYAQYRSMPLYAHSDWIAVLTPEEAEAIRNPPAPTPAQPDPPTETNNGTDSGGTTTAKYAGYGLIKADTPLYAEKPTDAGGQQTGTLKADTLVYVWDQEMQLSTGTLWDKIVVQLQDDLGGWVDDAAVQQITTAQGLEIIEARKTPVPTASPTPAPTATVRPAEGAIHRYGIVNSPGIKLRVVPPKGTIKESMSKNTVVYVRKAVYDGDDTWYQVDMMGSNGKVANYGYVLSEYVTLMDDEEEFDYVSTLTNPPTPYPDEASEPGETTGTETQTAGTQTSTPSPTATPVPTDTPKPTATPQPYNNYGITIVNNAPMRGNPTELASIINVLPINTVVFIVKQEYDATGMMWHLVYYGGQYGYMRADMLRYMTYTEISNYLAAQATPTPQPAVTAPTVTGGSESGYAELAKGGVNFRKSPSNSATVIRRLEKGTLVMVLGTTTGDNYTWYQVEHQGTTGYLRGDMVNVLTIAELNNKLATLQSSSSSSSGTSSGTSGTTNVTIPSSNSGLADLQSVDSGWTNNISLSSLQPMSVSPSPSLTLEPTETPDPFGLATDELGLFGTAAPVTAETEGSGPPFLLLGAGVVLLAGGATAYGLVLRNKNIKQQEAAAKRRAQQANGQRRATTQPVNRTGQAGVTSTIAGAAGRDKDKNATGSRRMPPSADGTRRTENDPVAQQRRAQQGGQNPYARPTSQGGQAGTAQRSGQNPYARPASQGGQAGAQQRGTTTGDASRTSTTPTSGTTGSAPRTGSSGSAGSTGSAPRTGSAGSTGSTGSAQRLSASQPRQGGSATSKDASSGSQQRPRTERRGSEKPPEDRG